MLLHAYLGYLISMLGTPATTSQMAKDVVTFLNWAAEPEHDERKKTGIKAVIIFSTLFAISLYVKRFKWGPIKNRKIRTFLRVLLLSRVTYASIFQSILLLPLKATRESLPCFKLAVDDNGARRTFRIIIERVNEHTRNF